MIMVTNTAAFFLHISMVGQYKDICIIVEKTVCSRSVESY